MSPSLHLRAWRVALLAAGLGYCSVAQTTGPAPLSLTQLTKKAGFIFAGRVLRVEYPASQPDRVPLVQITLQVERALRGTERGQTFILTQWAGAWDSGPQFRVGQLLLLFLYPRSPAGLTSVVGGRLGQFDRDAGGNIVLRAEQQRLLLPQQDESAGETSMRASSRYRYRDFVGRIRKAAAE